MLRGIWRPPDRASCRILVKTATELPTSGVFDGDKNTTLNTIYYPQLPFYFQRMFNDLIDIRHKPSGQFKWILYIKDHFSKYTQLYLLKSKYTEPIADAFALFIAAFLLPKIVQYNNGKEFKGALLILLQKYRIQVINRAL